MKKLILSVAAVVAVVSCNQKEMQAPSLVREVSIVANSTDTKTQLSENAVVWEANDAISLRFAKDAAYHVESFTTTQTGASVTFTGKLPNDVSTTNGYAATGYAVYPAAAMNNNGAVSYNLPSAVTANENGSFDSGKNISSAIVSLSDLEANGTTSANFKNALSIIRFTLSEGVKSIKISAGGNIAGASTMIFNNDGRLVVDAWTTPATEMTITPAGTSFTAAKTYNVLVYPGEYSTITAELTDVNDCKYTKTVQGPFNFVASNFYTFTFATKFEKTYTFEATGRTFAAGDQIQTVFGNLHSEVLAADASGKFTGNLPAEVVAANTEGYAIYPASAYSAGHISYTLDPAAPADLYSAVVRPTSTSVTFNSVASALAKLQFTVPAGVKSVTLSSTKPFAGATEMQVSNGQLVAGNGSVSEYTTTATGTVVLNVYPFSGADFTVTLADASGATVTKTVAGVSVTAGATQTLNISGDISFDKDGNFSNENFTNGGTYEF